MATTTADRETTARRVEILYRAAMQNVPGAPSARACVGDARVCMERTVMAVPFPGSDTDYMQWADSAAMWVERGAQHMWGFTRPAGW